MDNIHWTPSLPVRFCRLLTVKRVICGVTVALILFSTTSAVNNTFCTDLTPSTLTLEGVEVTHHMFGSEYNTLETLFSLEIEEIYEPVYKSECLKVCENNDNCRTEVRKKFLSQMGEHTRGSTVYVVESAQDYGNFTTYVNQRLSNWSPSTRSFFLTSCLSMCYQMLTKLDDPKPFDCLCPNPCKHQHSCQVKDCHLYGLFEHQYFCKCQEDEVWDEELYLCISTSVNKLRTDVSMRTSPSDPTACSSTAKCNPAGTLGCHHVVKMQLTTCICKAHFTGKRCEKLVNACESHIKHPHLPSGGPLVAGHKACNVNYNGNTCRSYISAEGDVYYRCKCNGNPWVPDPELAYDNCLKMRTMCDSTICVYGTCVTSSSGMHSTCICLPGYAGSACNIWLGEWTDWSPWDKCRPACGDVRYSVRTRSCPSLAENITRRRECRGASVEYARCNEHPCARIEGTYIDSYFAIRQDAIAATISTAAICCAIISLTWFFFFWSVLSKVVRGIMSKFQQSLDKKAKYRKRISQDFSL